MAGTQRPAGRLIIRRTDQSATGLFGAGGAAVERASGRPPSAALPVVVAPRSTPSLADDRSTSARRVGVVERGGPHRTVAYESFVRYLAVVDDTYLQIVSFD